MGDGQLAWLLEAWILALQTGTEAVNILFSAHDARSRFLPCEYELKKGGRPSFLKNPVRQMGAGIMKVSSSDSYLRTGVPEMFWPEALV